MTCVLVEIYLLCLPRRDNTTMAATPISIAAMPPHGPLDADLPGVDVATGGLPVTAATGVALDAGLRVGSSVLAGEGLRVGSGVSVGGTWIAWPAP